MQVWICEDEPAQRAFWKDMSGNFSAAWGMTAVRSFSFPEQVLFELDENVRYFASGIQVDG